MCCTQVWALQEPHTGVVSWAPHAHASFSLRLYAQQYGTLVSWVSLQRFPCLQQWLAAQAECGQGARGQRGRGRGCGRGRTQIACQCVPCLALYLCVLPGRCCTVIPTAPAPSEHESSGAKQPQKRERRSPLLRDTACYAWFLPPCAAPDVAASSSGGAGAAGEHGVQGFPTLKLFLRGKGGRPRALDYAGARQAAAVVEWTLDQVRRDALARLGTGAGGAPLHAQMSWFHIHKADAGLQECAV